MKKQNRTLDSRAALTATVCAGVFLAGTAAAADPPKQGWETVGSVGVTLTRGNSETFLANIGVNSSRKWSQDEILLGASAGYGENTTQDPVDGSDEHNTTDQYAKGFGQWNHLFTERLYGGVRLDALYDNIAGVDYRFTAGPLVGYYLIKNARTFLAVEAGPGFVAENLRDRPSEQYWILRFAERFEHKFNDKSKVWQSAEFVPRIDDFGDYVINAEVGVSSMITKSVDLRVVLQDTYRSEPPPGRKANDLKLIAGLGYRF